MSDPNLALRSIPLPAVFSALGVDLSGFKQRKGKNGREYYGKCFFHDAKNNNTALSFTDELWNCFSCSSKGRGAIDAVKEYRKCSFSEAVAFLQSIAGQRPAPNQKTAHSANSDATDGVLKPFRGSYDKFAVPCPWLEARIPDREIRDRYGVFMYNNPARKSAYSNRVMIPVRDIEGMLYGYLGRRTEENSSSENNEPKYFWPKNLPKSRFLFGAAELKSSQPLPVKVLYVVESCFATMRLAMLGVPSVALYGWSVSDEQIDILATLAKGVYYLCDRNKAQESAGVVHRLAQRMWVKAPSLPDGIDDAEYLTIEQLKAL
jgi:DNA primase